MLNKHFWRPIALSSHCAVGSVGSLVRSQSAKSVSIAYIILESIFVCKYKVHVYIHETPENQKLKFAE